MKDDIFIPRFEDCHFNETIFLPLWEGRSNIKKENQILIHIQRNVNKKFIR